MPNRISLNDMFFENVYAWFLVEKNICSLPNFGRTKGSRQMERYLLRTESIGDEGILAIANPLEK